MPAFNAEEYISDAIDSVLRQSFSDIEFIIVDDGSKDKTKTIVQSYDDKRIRFFMNKHDFIDSLNLGLDSSKGRYIARMDADDIMHIDRLKIQYAIMEEEPKITVCASWMSPFGISNRNESFSQSVVGLLEYPLLSFMKRNVIFHPTTMIRSDFLRYNSLQYENYECAEDYKLWVEIAKLGGVFYVESQPLLYYRVSEQQVSYKNVEIQRNTSLRIKKEIMNYLLISNKNRFNSIVKITEAMEYAVKERLLEENDVVSFFYSFFMNNKKILRINR